MEHFLSTPNKNPFFLFFTSRHYSSPPVIASSPSCHCVLFLVTPRPIGRLGGYSSLPRHCEPKAWQSTSHHPLSA